MIRAIGLVMGEETLWLEGGTRMNWIQVLSPRARQGRRTASRRSTPFWKRKSAENMARGHGFRKKRVGRLRIMLGNPRKCIREITVAGKYSVATMDNAMA